MMHAAYKSNKQCNNIQPWLTPFPIWNQSAVSCPVLTVASWPAYKISQEVGKVVWYAHFLQNFPHSVVIHTVKGFSVVSEADIFLEFSCLFYDPTDVGNLIAGSSASSKSSLYIWKFLVDILLKPSLKDFEHDLASVWNECNGMAVWTFFGIAFLWDWNENWPFPVLWPLLSLEDIKKRWQEYTEKLYKKDLHDPDNHDGVITHLEPDIL